MSSVDEKTKRRWWQPRFSLRHLVIFVTLVCVYFPAWEATKRKARKIEETSDANIQRCYSPGPLVLIQHELTGTLDGIPQPSSTPTNPARVYAWLFGPKIRLPFEWERPPYVWTNIDGKWTRSNPEDF